MLLTPFVSRSGAVPRRLSSVASIGCATALLLAPLPPAEAQTAAKTDSAQERSQRQSDNVYKWIKYFADQQTAKKADPAPARPKVEAPAPPVVKRAETRAPLTAGSTPMANSTDTPTAAPEPAPSVSEAAPQQQQAPAPVAPQTVAAAAVPEPPVIPPLRPVHVVEPSIPREMRDETINSRVLLNFTVQQDGTVAAAKVIAGNNRRLNRSAMDAIAQWRFEPIPSERLTQIEFEFRQE